MIAAVANKTIPAAAGTKVLKKEGETQDIVAEVIQCFKDSRGQLKNFAPHLKGATLKQTLYNVWHFWKYNITYQTDPTGVQWVQEPKALWQRKSGDCKSLSVAVMCTLYELDIKASFRFTSYGSNKSFPTHVYVVVLHNGKEIPVDCVWKEFGTQKPFTNKWDYNMTSIYRLAGFEESINGRRAKARKAARRLNKRGNLQIDVQDSGTTQAEMDLAVQKQKLELEQEISARVNGIGGLHDNAYEFEIAALHNAIEEIAGKRKGTKPTQKKLSKGQAVAPGQRVSKKTAKAIKKNTAGKAVNKKQAKKLEKLNIAVKKRKESLIKKVGKGLKKVVTAPARIAAKTQLPKNAPFFLYLFIDSTTKNLPEAVKIKRAKAVQLKNTLVNKLGMKESNFTGVVRNGIMNHFGDSPEAVIAKWMKDANFIGLLPLLAAAGKGILALAKSAGANIQSNLEQYAPSPEDWTGVSTELKEEIKRGVEDKEENNDVFNGKGSVPPQTETEIITRVDKEAKELDSTPAPVVRNSGGNEGSFDAGNDNASDEKEAPESPKKKDVEEDTSLNPDDKNKPASNNTMLWVASAATAVLLLSKGGRKKTA